ncbi:MAG: ATP-dependent DNA helicase RecG [Planctomycetota bacterium]|nr:ATP-dependent DNA helicase RecG [Planctomycetota bacterium]
MTSSGSNPLPDSAATRGNDATSPESRYALGLQTPVQFLRRVGPERAPLLERMRIHTVEDLLYYMPRDVLDLTEVSEPKDIKAGEMHTVCGTVVDIDGKDISGGRTMSAVLLDCRGHFVRGVWFNQSWVLKRFHHGEVVLFSGKPKWSARRWEFAHPKVQTLEDGSGDETSGGIHPKYGLTDGLKLHELNSMIDAALEDFISFMGDPLPDAFRRHHKLPRLPDAVRQLHRPASMDEFNAAKRRLIFDDLLEFQLGLALRRRAWRDHDQAAKLVCTRKIDARIRRLFPFEFTAGQNQSVAEICQDLASGRAMHRLLQADVGAGKTAVAMYAVLVAVAHGYQAVLMAPTEVLANQHWRTIDEALSESRVERLLLTGNLTPAQRRDALAAIAAGSAQLIVGTQAIIQEDVKFAKLGVVIIDEQHKFGVAQRAKFSSGGMVVDLDATDERFDPRQKRLRLDADAEENATPTGIEHVLEPTAAQQSDGQPASQEPPSPAESLATHVLVMTATPIPRSLCLTQFGDLDISTIGELPPGRQPIVTNRVVGPHQRKKAWEFVRKQLQRGRQAYVVCPRVDQGLGKAEAELAGSAEEVYQGLQRGELSDFKVGMIHGQLDRDQKTGVMESFRSGETQVLVSTTVIEVGVDVSNATMMLIYHADRFGLSQLHQLRGRIGRGRFQGQCFLFSDASTEDALKRLSAMESTSDGFKIAETDFEMRGPGDVLGTKQHGQLPLRVAHLLRDQAVLRESRKAAFQLVESRNIDRPEFADLRSRVFDRFGESMELSKSG